MVSPLSKLFLPAVLLLLCFVSGHATDASSTAAADPFTSSSHQCQLDTDRCKKGTFYATDIEGDGKYWKQLKVEMAEKKFCDDDCGELNKGYCFVYGGDAGDKGSFSMRIIRWLVKLKQKNPLSVCLIIGNRDGNKMRFLEELGEEAMAVPAKDTCVGILSGDININKKECTNCHTSETDDTIIVPCCCKPFTGNPIPRIGRLGAILDKTMGSVGDHERRETELAELAKLAEVEGDEGIFWKSFSDKIKDRCIERTKNNVDVDAGRELEEPKHCHVVESYILMASANLKMGAYPDAPLALGLYAEYLRYAQVAAFYPAKVDGEKGALFVHGMLDKEGMYKVPPLKMDGEQTATAITNKKLKNWAKELFDWNQGVMQQFTDGTQDDRCMENDWKEPAVTDKGVVDPKKFGCMTQRAGWMAAEWTCMAHLKAIRPVSTIIAGRSRTPLGKGNTLNDLCIDPNLLAVFVGHTPSGITPDVRVSGNGCVTINGDTSVLNGMDAGDGNHHGCGEDKGDPKNFLSMLSLKKTKKKKLCANFYSIIITPTKDAEEAFDIKVTGDVNRELTNFKPLLDTNGKVSGTQNEENKDNTDSNLLEKKLQEKIKLRKNSDYKAVTVGNRLIKANKPLSVKLTLKVPLPDPADGCNWEGTSKHEHTCVPNEVKREKICKRPTETKDKCFGEEATEGGTFMARLPVVGGGVVCMLSKGYDIYVDYVDAKIPGTKDGTTCPWKFEESDKLAAKPAEDAAASKPRFAGIADNTNALRLRRVVTSTSATSTSTSSTEAHIEQEWNELYGYPGAVGWLGDGIES